TIQVVVQEGLNEWTFFAEGCGYDSSGVSFFGKKPPVLSVSHLKQVCPGTPVTFGVASSGQVKLDFGDGSFATQFPAQHTYHSPSTTYLLSATATSTEGCAKTWAGSVQTFAQPEAAIQLPDPLCASAPVPVSNIGTGASTCAWQVGDPPVLYDGCSATVVFQKPGLQPLRLSVTSADGCMDDTTRTVFVRESPVPVLDVSPKTAVCTGTTLRFESKSTSATGLKIDFGDGASATGGPVFEHAYAKGGSYTVTLTATKDGLCAATATATVQVYDRPPFALSLTEGCTQALGYTLTVNAPAVRATLVKPDGSRDSSSLTFRYLQPGIHHLLLTSAISGCRADTTLHILPVAELRFTDFPPDTTLWLGDSCLLSASANLTGVAFAWSPTEWLSAPSAPDPMARPLREGVYRYVLSATDARMCAVLDTVVVRVLFEKDPAVLPTAFTPNGDGVYDALRVRSRHAGAVRQMRFLVYDPWGALMFEAEAGCLPNDESPGCAWDGLLRDQPVKPGPYRAEVLIEYLNGTRAVFSQNIMLAH
ncbi:MAG TPA: PKD domain-containing protein, partial [Saprospiraceae bacterium]|nr:PKD domain-containing protein [Saprospiraceae bacterium]